MIWFKSCPRCSGDLMEDSDGYGKYVSCLACGHYLSSADEVTIRFGSLTTIVGNRGAKAQEAQVEVATAA